MFEALFSCSIENIGGSFQDFSCLRSVRKGTVRLGPRRMAKEQGLPLSMVKYCHRRVKEAGVTASEQDKASDLVGCNASLDQTHYYDIISCALAATLPRSEFKSFFKTNHFDNKLLVVRGNALKERYRASSKAIRVQVSLRRGTGE